MTKHDVERQARLLAAENRKAEPGIEKVYWFPDEHEVRLVELMRAIPESDDDQVHPYHFRPSPANDLPAPSGIALIRPDEFGKLRLPERWGGWNEAVLLEDQK